MLNTLKTNLILTRAVLIALFAGLFILAACGGGGGAAAPTTATPPAANPCDTNPFGTTCTRAADIAARSLAITNCATSYNTRASKFDCDFVPQAVVYCLRDPLATSGTTACDATAYDTARQGSGVTISEVRSTRVILCRDDSNRNETLCNSTVVQNCGDDANPFDLVCGRLNPARNAIIENCVDSATLADSTKNADCVAARTAGFTCFDNPWAESCVTSTMYREFASFRADAQASRLAYCLDDDADSGVCASAMARVCADSGDGANPFSDLCTATSDTVRADFATNCFNGETNGADCTAVTFELPRTGTVAECDGEGNAPATLMPTDAACMTRPTPVATCADAPFSTDCREVATFAGARSAFATNCFNDEFNNGNNGADCTVDAFSITRVGDDALCGNGSDIAGTDAADPTCATSRSVEFCVRAPFSMNCKTGDIFAGARAGLITYCTGVDSEFTIGCGQTGLSCIGNPFDTSQGVDCEEQLGSEQAVTDAQNNLITRCTGADTSDQRCVTNVMGAVADCLANPFDAACDTALGSEAQATAAQNNIISLCTGADADGTNALCMTASAGMAVADCLANPFETACDMALGTTQAETAQNNLIALCTGADADGTNAVCMTASAGMAVADCLANPFGSACETTLGTTQAETAQNNLIDVCTGADADGSNTRCTVTGDTELTGCLDDPFSTGCDTELGSGLATAQSNVIALCAGDAITTNALCMGLTSDVKTCIDDPFTPDANNGINCGTTLGATVRDTLQSDIVALCTGEGADGTNARCVTAVANRSCLTNPFDATPDLCSGQLGATLLATAKSNVIALCTGDDALAATNALCASAAAVVTCLTNPFDTSDNGSCAGADEVDLTALQNNRYEYCLTDTPDVALCTDTLYMTEFCSATSTNANANIFHANCDGVTDIDVASTGARAVYCAANMGDDNCSSMTACGTNPFGATCFFDGNRYDDERTTTITNCDPTATSPVDPDCAGVIVEASDSANNITVGSCKANPFLTGCGIADFDATRTASATACNGVVLSAGDRTGTTCEQVIIAADTTQSVTLVNVGTCIDNPFASGCETLEAFAVRRNNFASACNLQNNKMTGMCATPIGGTTVAGCGIDPFHADCLSLDTFASGRCTAQPFNTECLDNAAYDGARCTANPFYMDCAMDTSLDGARDAICMATTTASSIFNVNCTEDDYTGTDAARKTIADGCRAGTTTTGCDAVVSDATGAPTIAACNTNPYATGCDATVFADALTAYCADGAPTIFNTNCDSRTNIEDARSVAIGVCVAALTTDKTDASCTGREIVAGEEEVTAIIEGTTMVDHDNNPDTPDIVARAEDARDGVPAVPAVTVGVCLDDPFHTSCASDLFDEFRADHMEVCMSNGNANLPSCANINTGDITYQTCLRNPFDTACTTSASGHRFRNARAARYAFCEGSRAGSAASVASGDTDLCGSQGAGETGTTIRGEICSYAGGDEGERLNPFAGVCSANTYVSSKKYYCGVGGRRASDANCNDIVADNSINTADGCLANPFSDTCTADLPSTGATITEELRTFLTMQRTTYCTAVDAEGFDETLCQTTDTNDADFASTVCQGQTADANPFAPFCVRDGNTFDADRVTFVQACAALATGTELAGGATCTQAIIDCNTNAYGADCVNENAYASVRQTVVTNCVTAFNAGTHANNADCTTIMGVGQLTCITTNPYLNRPAVDAVAETTPGAGDGTDAVIGLNCLGNANFAAVRTALESGCVSGGTGDPASTGDRCPVLLAGVCGRGTTTGGDAVAGTNPFNADFCTGTDNVYAAHRKAVIDSCDGTTVTTSCTAEINACINNPFLVDGITTGDNSVDCDDATISAAFVNPTITYCGTGSTDNSGTVTANISLEKCQTFATTNTCVANPFGSTCDNAMLGGATDALTTARSLRTTYCSGLGTSSATIRGDGTSAYCLGAAENFCKGDNLFASTPGAGVFDCLSDTGGTYTADRATHAGLCANVSSDDRATAGTDCDLAEVQICTTTTIGLQTNPWSSICSEDNADPTAARQAVINACLAKAEGTAAGERGEVADTNVCTRAIDDGGSSVPNNDVVEILATCTAEPRDAACDDFAGTAGEGYADARSALYVSGCAGDSPDAALCPAAKVQPVICVTNGDNSRPFAEICETGVTDIETYKEEVLTYCLSVASAGNQRCVDGTAPTTKSAVDLVKTACGGSAPTNNPFNGAVSVTGVIGTLDCNTYNFFDNDRNTFATQCRNSITGYNCATITGALALICNASTGSAANPFSALCAAAPHAQSRLAFATLCVGKTAGVAIDSGSNLAICPAEVIACADGPFGSETLCADAAFNAQKTSVLDACKTSASIITGASTRCTTARDDVTCLKDPFNCTGTIAQFSEATGGAVQYLTDLTTDRFTYCGTGANINAQKTICRTASGPHSFCLANPFGTGCNNFLGDDAGEDFREDRIAFCFGDGSANANTAAKAVVTNRIGTARQALLTIDDVALCATPLTGVVTQYLDAIGFICYGSAVGATQTEAAATGDKSRDPFSAFCLADADYNARRAERILECANANTIGTTTTSVTSTAFTTSDTPSCNWAQQVNLCAKSDTGSALDAQCGTLNTVTKWHNSQANPLTFTNDIATTANQFVRGTTVTDGFEYLDTAGAVSADLNGAHNGTVAYGGLPTVSFFSARKKAVAEVIEVLEVVEVVEVRVDSTLDGMEVTLADGTVIASVDDTHYGMIITAAVAPVAPVAPVAAVPAGEQRFYATINAGNVGRPVFNRNNPAAVWTGQIHWIGNGTAVLNHTNARTFKAQVNFAERTIEGAVSINTGASNPLGNHLVIDGDYTGAGIITGTTYIRNYTSNYNVNAPNIRAGAGGANTSTGVVSGLIGHRGAVGAFISDGSDNTNGYAGGFAVCSTALVNNNCPQ